MSSTLPHRPHPFLSQSFLSSDIAFTRIDEEIAVLRSHIHSLYAFRNSFTPIARLPPEILTHIFIYVRQYANGDLDYFNGDAGSLDWIIISHVSQHWRDVALESPELWSYISNSYHNHLRAEWLRRSKNAPLTLDLRRTTAPDIYWIVAPSHFRIRDLNLVLSSSVWNNLCSTLSKSAPQLETFSVTITDSVDPPLLTDKIFAGATPNLRRLEVSGCSIDFTRSPLFVDLRELKLSNPTPLLAPTYVLSSLKHLPHLTRLSLSGIFDPLATVPADVGTVSFPCLEFLSLTGSSLGQGLTILSHLSIPMHAQLHFAASARGFAEDPITTLIKFLKIYKTIRQQELPPTLLYHLQLQTKKTHLTLVISAEYPTNHTPSLIHLLDLDLIAEWGDTLEISNKPDTATLFSDLPLSSTKSFRTNCAITVGTWANVFGTLPELKEVYVSGNPAYYLFTAIINNFTASCPTAFQHATPRPAGWSGMRGRGRKALPKAGRGAMRVKPRPQPALVLPSTTPTPNPTSSTSSTSAAIHNPPTSQIPDHWNPIFSKLEVIHIKACLFPMTTTDLVAALSARKVAGKPLGTLDVAGCHNVDEDVMESLIGSVENLEWDGWLSEEGQGGGSGVRAGGGGRVVAVPQMLGLPSVPHFMGITLG